MNYTILLPPSEGKAEGGNPRPVEGPSDAFFELGPQRAKVVKALHSALKQSKVKREKLFGVKGEALERAMCINAQVPDGPLLPAIERYSGVMFDFLDYATMPAADRQKFDARAIIFSGLYGILRPTDPICDYKLKMDATLPSKRVGNVASFWKPHISAILNERLAGHVVWDLLPGAHARAWDGKTDYAARWQVKFVQRVEKGGKTQLKTVTHWSKALKGALVRFVCAHDVTAPDAFSAFEHPEGYRFAPAESEMGERGGELVFVKKP